VQLERQVEIDASADVVWEVVTDLAAWPDWNPFVVACRSTLAVGDPIAMRVRMAAGPAWPQRERVLVHEPGRRLCWGVADWPTALLASERCQEVEPLGPDRARYRSRFALRGVLEPVVRALFGRRIERGLEAMTEALRRRAESRSPSSPGAPRSSSDLASPTG
jgi:hypothetical protein